MSSATSDPDGIGDEFHRISTDRHVLARFASDTAVNFFTLQRFRILCGITGAGGPERK